jgi:hypothetical protein
VLFVEASAKEMQGFLSFMSSCAVYITKQLSITISTTNLLCYVDVRLCVQTYSSLPRPSKHLKIKIIIACVTVIDNSFVRTTGLTNPAPAIHVLVRFFPMLSFFSFFLFCDVSKTGCTVTIAQNIGMITMPVGFTERFTLVIPVPSTTTMWQQCELATLE